MATKTNSTKPQFAKFLSAVVAPIAADAEQVDTSAFRKSVLADMKAEWHLAKRLVDATNHERIAASIRDDIDFLRTGVRTARHAAEYDRFDWSDTPHYKACDALMRVPAPTIGALRWKQGARGFNGGCEAWDRAIAADVSRLEPHKVAA